MTEEPFLQIFGKAEVLKQGLPVALTLGNFDGFHLGHQAMIRRLIQEADRRPTVVVTFFPHPTRVLTPGTPKPLLYSMEERVSQLLESGVDCVVVREFSKDFAGQSADSFCEDFLKRTFNVSSILLGYDFTYGKNRQGNFAHLQAVAARESWNVSQATAVLSPTGQPVSSTQIRDAITRGDVAFAEELLGRPYALKGFVVRGDQRGRTMGFPTANLKWENEVVPAGGVYACLLDVEGVAIPQLPSVMNCGVRPTIGKDLRLQIEAHILDFSDDIYDRKVKFFLKQFLRPERRFLGLEELVTQIHLDCDAARRYFRMA